MAGLFNTLSRRLPQLAKISIPVVQQVSLRNFCISSTLSTPRVQQPAPVFSGTAVVNGAFKTIQLSDYKGKYVVLVFYPLDFTFVCPTELIALDDRISEFKALNAEVIGCSIDSHFSHLGWMNTKRAEGGLGTLKYPLLSDINKENARRYDVLLEEEGIALRGMFIIDPNGILRQITINDLPIGRSVDEALRVIEALRFVEEHGEETSVPGSGWGCKYHTVSCSGIPPGSTFSPHLSAVRAKWAICRLQQAAINMSQAGIMDYNGLIDDLAFSERDERSQNKTDLQKAVCPANWRKGQKTIKPDPKGSQEYFRTTHR